MSKQNILTRTEALDVLLVPQALRRVRQATGLRQIDVAVRSGLSKAMVSAYEGGKALPSLPSLSAYLGAIPQFDNRDLAKAAGSILGDEAMHWAVLRNALGENPVPAAFVA